MTRRGLEIAAIVAGVAIAHDLSIVMDLALRDRSAEYASLGVASIIAIWSVLLAIVAIVWRRGGRPPMRPPRSARTLASALFLIGTCVAVDWIFSFPLAHVVTGAMPIHWPSSWLSFVAIALAGPLVEEWLIRGVLWNALASRTRGPAAVIVPAVITSLLFGAWHCRWMLWPSWVASTGTPVALHVAFGACMAVLRWRFRSIGPGVVVHGLWNALYPLTG